MFVYAVDVWPATELANYLLVDPGVSDGRANGYHGAVQGKTRRKSAESAKKERYITMHSLIYVT